jgi:hypothetical protein
MSADPTLTYLGEIIGTYRGARLSGNHPTYMINMCPSTLHCLR